jgi:hypothetical protein
MIMKMMKEDSFLSSSFVQRNCGDLICCRDNTLMKLLIHNESDEIKALCHRSAALKINGVEKIRK